MGGPPKNRFSYFDRKKKAMKFFIFEQKIYAFVENSICDLKVHSASKSVNGGPPHNNFFTEGGVVTKILCLLNVHF